MLVVFNKKINYKLEYIYVLFVVVITILLRVQGR